MNDCDIAWAAGLFEGEGTVIAQSAPKRKDGSQRRYPSMCVEMTTEEPVRKFAEIVGANVTTRIRPTGVQFWRAHITSWVGCIEVYATLRPWLSQRRRDQWLGVFERCETTLLWPSQHGEWRHLFAA